MTAVVPDGLPDSARSRAMLVIILGLTVAVLDGSVVNLASIMGTHGAAGLADGAGQALRYSGDAVTRYSLFPGFRNPSRVFWPDSAGSGSGL